MTNHDIYLARVATTSCLSYIYALGLSQPLRFLVLFFTTLFDPLFDGVAVVTTERSSPFPVTGGKLGTVSMIQYGKTRHKTYPAFESPLRAF
jgi:hypothetical protein